MYIVQKLVILPFISLLINFYWILPIGPMSRELNSGFDSLPQIYPTNIPTHLNTFFFSTNFSLFGEFSSIFRFFNSFLFKIFYILFMVVIFWRISKNINHDSKLKTYLFMYLLVFVLSLGLILGFYGLPFNIYPGHL